MRIRRMTAPPDVREVDEKIAEVRLRKESAIDAQDFEKAASLRRGASARRGAPATRARVEVRRDGCPVRGGRGGDRRGARHLDRHPGLQAHRGGDEKLLRMEDELHKRIISQEDSIKAVSKAIRRTRAGLKDPKRPSGSFIFLGPRASGRPSSPRRSPSSCSATRPR